MSVKKTLLILCVMVFSLMMIQPGLAAEAYVGLPVSQTLEGTSNSTQEILYVLTPETAGAPMPAGTENGVYKFSMKGNVKMEIPVIHCTEYGTWNYTLRADTDRINVTPGAMTVTLTYTEGVSPMVTAMLSSGEKCEMSFTVPGGAVVSPSPTPTGGTSTNTPKTTTAKGSTPKTGDDFPLMWYAFSLIISALMLVLLWRRSRKGLDQR